MFATLIALELAVLDQLSREQLIAALLERRDGLVLEFTREWLEEQSKDRLQLFLLAAKLLSVVRQKGCRSPTASPAIIREREK